MMSSRRRRPRNSWVSYEKKLIEVALPLEAINKESCHERSPSDMAIHRLCISGGRGRPLAACLAVLFASLWDDPSGLPEQFPTEADQDKGASAALPVDRRVGEMGQLQQSGNLESCPRRDSEVYRRQPTPDLRSILRRRLNSVGGTAVGARSTWQRPQSRCVLITKALIEIPPKFAGLPPVIRSRSKR